MLLLNKIWLCNQDIENIHASPELLHRTKVLQCKFPLEVWNIYGRTDGTNRWSNGIVVSQVSYGRLLGIIVLRSRILCLAGVGPSHCHCSDELYEQIQISNTDFSFITNIFKKSIYYYYFLICIIQLQSCILFVRLYINCLVLFLQN